MTLMLSRKILPPELSAEHLFSVLQRTSSAYFWLDSSDSKSAGTQNARSYLGFSEHILVAEPARERDFLAEVRSQLRGSGEMNVESQSTTTPMFSLGWVGWFSYEFGQALLGLEPHYDPGIAPAVMLRVRAAVEVDHASGQTALIAEDERASDEWMRTFESLQKQASQPADLREAPPPATRPDWRDSTEVYGANIERCQRAIHDGDAYLMCLTTSVSVTTAEDPAEVYLRLRKQSPTHHGGFISAAGVTLASASPEQFLSVNAAGVAHTKPIKGTRPRGVSDDADHGLRAELGADQKELAENLMIVDLMRNDFAQVCTPESVGVVSLHEVETYEHVHQLVSTVQGQLRPECDAIDLLTQSFPAGSMTGAPKRSAVNILSELESAPRGLYSGCFGYFSHDGCADFAMVIRSIVFSADRASIGTGGGITALSQADAEIAEVHLKARALLAALELPQRPVM